MNRKVEQAILCGIFHSICVSSAFAQKQTSGTIIVFGVSNQFIAVAADSKMIEENTGKQKTECKITTLGDKSIFAFTGMTFFQSVPRPELRWDAHAEARNAFETVGSLGIPGDPGFLAAVAQQWVQNFNKVLSQMTASDPDWFWRHIRTYTDEHSHAFFGGFDSVGNIGVVEVRTSLDPSPRTFGFDILSYQEDEKPTFFAIGQTQVAAEFILLKTARARREYSWWLRTVRGESPVQRASLRTIDLVRLSIKYLPPSAGVGLPIHAAILQRNGTIQWVPGKACH